MMLKEIKYEFYKCKDCVYKDNVPGNAHIQCTFDWIGALKDMTVPYYPMGIVHGIKSGWYEFPFLFDPTWMAIPCPAFHPRSDKETTLRKSDETLRILMSMKFKQRGMDSKITEEDFNSMIEKYNEVMKQLEEEDSE